MKRTGQFKSPKTPKGPPLTNRDWAKLVAKRNNRTGRSR